jgi:hypothetical protein
VSTRPELTLEDAVERLREGRVWHGRPVIHHVFTAGKSGTAVKEHWEVLDREGGFASCLAREKTLEAAVERALAGARP